MVVRLRMHRSGLSYIQTDLNPDDVKFLVLVAAKEGNVTDIAPIYREKITSSACTSIEDAKRMLKEGENISVIIEMV